MEKKATSKRYPPELKERAVRMVRELEDWTARLDGLNIDHSEIVDESYGSGLSFRDPDNIALEFFAPPA
jgi:hypothetical protein